MTSPHETDSPSGNRSVRLPSLVKTGIPNLDLILGGGIPVGDVLLLIGPPGAGKTTLALQMLFHAAASGHNVIFVATLSEPTTRLLEHVRGFTFYDESLLGKRLTVVHVYPLIREGLARLTEAIVRETGERHATFVVVDGLMTIHDLYLSPADIRAFVYELGALLAAKECTTVFTSVATPPNEEYRFPEFTMTDGVVELGFQNVGTQTFRTIKVRKLRGLAPLLGQHTLRIDDTGLRVFPRLESTLQPIDVGLSPNRMPLGLPELDGMMSGGPRFGSLTLLAGALATGKTLACLHFLLEGARRGQRGLFVGLEESPRRLVAKARAFGMDLQSALDGGSIAIFHRSAVDLLTDVVTWEIREEVDRLAPQRMALDSIDEINQSLFDERRKRGYLVALSGLLEDRQITTLVTKETDRGVGPELDFSGTPLAVVASNLLLFRWVDYRSERFRIVSVLKMRDSAHDSSIRQYTIGATGMHVMSKTESAEGVLTGIARLPAESRRRPFRE